MASYYYLVSSLPDLKADGQMPLSYEEFLDMCKGVVDQDTYEMLENLNLEKSRGGLMEEWSRTSGALTKELNYQRSLRMGKTYSTDFDKDSLTAQVVNSALSAKNPLEAETILLDYQFQKLDDLVGLHMFDDYVLLGYAIKLRLLERQSCFDHEKGKNEFRRLLGDVQQRVYSLNKDK